MTTRGAFVTAIAGTGIVAYLALLLAVSLRSHERVLPPGESLRFCGFYLDCHLSAAVEGHTTDRIAEGGTRYTVRVRFASDAMRATLSLRQPTAWLVDDLGRRLPASSGPTGLRLAADSAIVTDFVFEVPGELLQPRLRIRKGDLLERASEFLLIGDPDSFLHAPVTLALGVPQ